MADWDDEEAATAAATARLRGPLYSAQLEEARVALQGTTPARLVASGLKVSVASTMETSSTPLANVDGERPASRGPQRRLRFDLSPSYEPSSPSPGSMHSPTTMISQYLGRSLPADEGASNDKTEQPRDENATASSSLHLSQEAGSHLLRSLSATKGSTKGLGSPRRLPLGSQSADRQRAASNSKATNRGATFGASWSADKSGSRRRGPGSARRAHSATPRRRKASVRARSTPRDRERRKQSADSTQAKAKAKPRPAWDSTIHDLSKYKLDKEAQKLHRLTHTSRFDRSARKRLEKEGISVEEQESTLSAVLSPPWLIRHTPKQEKVDQEEDEEEEEDGGERHPATESLVQAHRPARSSAKSSKNESPETGDASSWTERSDSTDTNEAAAKRGQLDAAFEELKAQVSRYETATGRSGSAYLGDQLDESETDPMANREMDLMKLCTRLIGHLAHCERDLAERTERLKIVDDEKRSLEAENQASRQHCEDLNDQVNTLQRELTALRASGSHSQVRTEVALPTFAYESPSPRRAHREADLARISRRHELLARWQAASQ